MKFENLIFWAKKCFTVLVDANKVQNFHMPFLHPIYNSNEEDVGKITEDEETLEGENSLGMKESMREAISSDILAESTSVPTPEQLETASSSAEHQLYGARDEEKLSVEDDSKKAHWPSMVDLNTRLRRVITSYQRNFKKEEMRLAQKAKVCLVQNVYFRCACLVTSLQNKFFVTVEAAVSDFNILSYKSLNMIEFICSLSVTGPKCMWPAWNYIRVLIDIVWQCKFVPLISKFHHFRAT